MPGVPILILAIVASAIVFAPLSSWLALQRGRSWLAWFFFGIALGPIAAALLIAAPPGRCPACGTRSRGWPRHCAGCGLAFSGDGSDVASIGTEAAGFATGTVPSELATPTATRAGAASPPARRTSRGGRRAGAASHVAPTGDTSRRPATALGRRATEVQAPPPAPARRTIGTVAILGSGIFMGGTEPLQIGSRYFLAQVGSELQMLGPMHISPSAVAARIALAGTQTTVVADRLLITGGDGGGGPTLAFSAVAAEPGVDFQEQLLVRGKRTTVTS